MKLNIKKSIENNIVTVDISVAELGTTSSVQDEERNLLADFPRSVKYSDINFVGNMKADSSTGDPVVTTDDADGTNIVEVSLKDIINKEYPIQEDMNIVFSIDVTKIPDSELNDVMDTVEKLGKAKAELFATRIHEEIGKKLAELRSLNTKFEGETEVVL